MMNDIAALNLAIADEMVYTDLYEYYNDFLSYVAIGARSSENPTHRHFASMIDLPIGMKNPSSGSISKGVNATKAAQTSEMFIHNHEQIQTTGNMHAHLILRGGESGPNCDEHAVRQAIELLKKELVQNPAIIIDVSHDNSINSSRQKDHHYQVEQIKATLQFVKNEHLTNAFKGWMVESFIMDGKQDAETKTKNNQEIEFGGLSITDACIGWQSSSDLVYYIYQHL
jgi:3-deoxy-7-phosphoheptulonate synthase